MRRDWHSRGELLAVYIRFAFASYAIGMGALGLLLLGWGPALAGGVWAREPWELASMLRLAGLGFLAVAGLTAPLALADDARIRLQALPWFAAVHLLVVAVVATQQIALWEDEGLERLIRGSFVVACAFGYLWLWSSGRIRPIAEAKPVKGILEAEESPAQRLRSEFEEGIRRVAQQEERNRLARDLHDSIKQQLFIVQTAAATAQARFAQDSKGTQEALERIRDSSREAVAEMDALLTQLRAAPVERTGFVEALRKQCEALAHRTGAAVRFEPGEMPDAGDLPAGVYENLYRVAQEALHNVGKHARATSVCVQAGRNGLDLALAVVDDGAGFDPNTVGDSSPGMGIRNMRERATEAGATFALKSQPNGGTQLRVSVPLRSVDLREHRRQALINGGCLIVAIVAIVTLRSPEVMVALSFPLIMALGYHLRALWIAHKGREAAA